MADKNLEIALRLKAETEGFESGVDGAKRAVSALTSAMAALGIGIGIKELGQTADEFKNLEGRIKLAVGAMGDATGAMAGVGKIAIETRSNLIETGNLFATINRSAKELNLTQEQALELTRTINQATIVGGGSASSNAAAIVQLNQALQSGVLRGEEFNSIMEQAPRIAKALADGLGVTTGELRKMANAGELTSQVVTKALQSQADTINREFAQMPITIGGAIENLKTAWTLYIGEADKASGVSAAVAKSIKFVADNLDTLAGVLTLAAKAAAAYKAVDLALTLNAKANAARTAQIAITTETAAIVTNTQANVANAVAARSAATAHSSLAGSVGQTLPTFTGMASRLTGLVSSLGAYGAAAAAAVVVGKVVYDGLDALGTKIGETTAKWVLHAQGLKTAEEQEKATAEAEKRAIEAKKEYAKALQDQAEKSKASELASLGLSAQSKELVKDFDKLTALGKTAAEAIASIGKSMQFDSLQAIDTSLAALAALQKQGKITEEQISAIFANTLKGQDLIVFEANAKAAFASVSIQIGELTTRNENLKKGLEGQRAAFAEWKNSGARSADEISNATFQLQQKTIAYGSEIKANEQKLKELSKVHDTEARKMAMLQDQLLNAAIDRTGLSLEQLQGKSSKAFVGATNDVQFVINNLDKLKDKGIDVGLALGKSFENAINTASSQAELDALKSKIEANRDLLGSRITDGLLQQAEAQAIKAKAAIDAITPGLQSVAEATKVLGIKTKDELNLAADAAKSAYEVIRGSSEVSAAGQRKALQAVIDAAYESGDASRMAYAKGEAAAKGFTLEVDKSGKAIIKSMFDAESSTDRVSSGFGRIGNAAHGAARSTGEAAQAAVNSLDAWSKKLDEITRKSGGMTGNDFLNSGSSGNSSASGAQTFAYTSEEQIMKKLMDEAGYDAKRAKVKAHDLMNDTSWAKATDGAFNWSLSNYDYINKTVADLARVSNGTTGTPAKTVKYDIKIGNNSAELYGNTGSEDQVNALMAELERLKKGM